MLGELSCMIEDCEEKLQRAFEEKEQFEIRNKGKMDRHLYVEKLEKLNDKIRHCQAELRSAIREYDSTLREESDYDY